MLILNRKEKFVSTIKIVSLQSCKVRRHSGGRRHGLPTFRHEFAALSGCCRDDGRRGDGRRHGDGRR